MTEKENKAVRLPVPVKPPAPPKEDELVRLPIQLTRAQAIRLRSLAVSRLTDISGLVRAAVDSFFGPSKPGSRSDAAGRTPKPGKLPAGVGKPALTREELEELLKNR